VLCISQGLPPCLINLISSGFNDINVDVDDDDLLSEIEWYNFIASRLGECCQNPLQCVTFIEGFLAVFHLLPSPHFDTGFFLLAVLMRFVYPFFLLSFISTTKCLAGKLVSVTEVADWITYAVQKPQYADVFL
jgi:Ni,Fe-hydrogenase I cytochrome b subunit